MLSERAGKLEKAMPDGRRPEKARLREREGLKRQKSEKAES